MNEDFGKYVARNSLSAKRGVLRMARPHALE
jgi:hypothetical protein